MKYLLFFSALILSSTAAYFSVTGLAALFHGAYWPVIIMAGGLEFSKLVALSFVYRYWEKITHVFKSYLLICIAVLMLITSAGIYGFLSSAYSVTADKIAGVNNNIGFFEKKKQVFIESNNRLAMNIKNKNNRIETLTGIRANQEARIDTLYKKNLIKGVRATEKIINNTNLEIEKANKQIDDLDKLSQANLDSISAIDLQIMGLNNSSVSGEVSPLRYISALTGKDINIIVNFFIVLLIFVFDPLAICLVIATNKVMLLEGLPEVIVAPINKPEAPEATKEPSPTETPEPIQEPTKDELYAFLDNNPGARPSDFARP